MIPVQGLLQNDVLQQPLSITERNGILRIETDIFHTNFSSAQLRIESKVIFTIFSVKIRIYPYSK